MPGQVGEGGAEWFADGVAQARHEIAATPSRRAKVSSGVVPRAAYS
ncbi:MAG: hypothetical protein HY023_16230 [Chloroflexi bacterium]|nr:hypothetical protein [Chloroflexota bacterium]